MAFLAVVLVVVFFVVVVFFAATFFAADFLAAVFFAGAASGESVDSAWVSDAVVVSSSGMYCS